MESSDQKISELIDHLRWIRLAVLPPYCGDEDEGERSEADYVTFFNERADGSISATEKYRESIAALDDLPSKEAVEQLLAGRRAFINAFPFCTDELAGEPVERSQPLENYIISLYRSSQESRDSLISDLEDYRVTVVQLQHLLNL